MVTLRDRIPNPDSRFPIPVPLLGGVRGGFRFPIPDSRFPIPDFLTIPILTQSLIVETTALDLLATLTIFTTFTTLSSLFPVPYSLFPKKINCQFFFFPLY
ncbi:MULTISPECIES: hypothetical protein [unclassified Moorena]|uniref:hypothetical protein n=1 Tax=unclassified Moorena TaxID=2683338 RepID=UPI0013B98F89|nr:MULTISPECIES: hypothetical protein [unclassified Moorena]NEP35868.1 hypothetical protein [Moorena sp. SIO3B2]NEQ05603.1 hypothetical protein [Moorena sp. SIO4E2]